MTHAAGSGPQPGEGDAPEEAHFPETARQQPTARLGPTARQQPTAGAADTPETSGAPGAFDAATTPVPADWYLRDQPSASTARPESTPEAPSGPIGRRRGDDREPPRRGRRTLVVWGLAGALVLAGAALFLGAEDDNKDRVNSVTGAEPAPGPTSAPPTGASSSSEPSSSKPPSSSSSASSTAKAPANDVDAPKDPSALKPAAYAAWKRIDAAMAADGIKLNLNSGKRGWAHQQKLLDEKIAEVGSRQEAIRWVLPPEKSMHVQGVAVDIYPANAQAWLQAKGGKYGWCRMYDNEEWHFEYNASYTSGCPKRLPSALDS
ncbi:D-alanyl-D-alanine carboxypeptidase family protein (plasmid) [Embleya sp. NBC_00888]|uniref:D-alanyl-D-alanine carboxypeptidase family protein n=1 Tax=Embleya sp. NBC_00888 TaxID=2975960 RepID=UPI002F917A5B|nr:D-alanyl-D-alanine carboxypeptidase family protein [Embleya sp. NBC_00888]